VCQNFFTKTCLSNNFFSRDPHFVILAWVQSWNILENSWNCEVRQTFFTKTCLTNNHFWCDPHYVILAWVQKRNISEKLMKVCSKPEFFSQKHVSQTITFHMIHIPWFLHGYKVKIIMKNWWNCDVRTITFHVIHISWF